MSERVEERPSAYRFGTFKGVFTPSILTILGVVMYLRMGWVLGQVGLGATILIITIASGITFVTALSLSALATNMRVGGGGAYYVIARSLGVEAGAAIGIPLFLAQALGISFYIAGFSESLAQVFPALNPTVVGLVTGVALAALALVSADLALRSQFVIMVAIGASLISFFFGGAPEPSAVSPDPELLRPLSFWPVFAVFFPAVTGIEAGIAMSGDLKNPTRSLPLGTIAAVLVGYAVYLAIPIMLHVHDVPREVLLSDPLVMQKSARWGSAVLVGIWAASLSSAMGALLGAPRTLQALAKDRVVPADIGRAYGPHGDPRLATFIAFGVGMFGVLLGDMNTIAPLLSMFFLTSYGMLNLLAGFEELISSPSWRPQFRLWAWVPLAGFASCLAVMLMLAPGATMVAIVTCAGIYYAMKRRSLRAHWGDMRQGFMMYATRILLHRMAGRAVDERMWKPNLLVLSGSPTSRWYLVELADAIAQSRSFVTVASFIPEENWTADRVETITHAIRTYLRKRKVPAFIRTLPADDPYEGAATMIHAYGFGPITPNTILIGETEKPSSFVRFAGLIALIARANRNLVIVRERANGAPVEPDPAPFAPRLQVDLWWSKLSSDTAFILALAILLRRSAAWRNAELRFRTTVATESERAEAEGRLRKFLTDARVDATPEVIVRNGRSIFDVIRSASQDAELVFLAMRAPGPHESAEAYSGYYEELLRETEALPTTALVMAGEKVDFTRIFAEP